MSVRSRPAVPGRAQGPLADEAAALGHPDRRPCCRPRPAGRGARSRPRPGPSATAGSARGPRRRGRGPPAPPSSRSRRARRRGGRRSGRSPRAAGRRRGRRRPGRATRRRAGAPGAPTTKSRASSARRRASARGCSAGSAGRWTTATSGAHVVPPERAQHDALVAQRGVGQDEHQNPGLRGGCRRACRGGPGGTGARRPRCACGCSRGWRRVPISSGRLVPWIATRPLPPANSLSVSE